MSSDRIINAFDLQTWSSVEKHYFGYIDEAFEKNKKIEFSNGKPCHAVYLIRAFLKNASDHVRLFSGKLSRKGSDDTEIYQAPEVIESACQFLSKRNTKLDIVLEQDIDGGNANEHPLIEGIMGMEGSIRGNFGLFQASPDELDFLKSKSFLYHFMTMDDRGIRLETDSTNLEDIKAIVRIGNKETTKGFAHLFDSVILCNAKQIISKGPVQTA